MLRVLKERIGKRTFKIIHVSCLQNSRDINEKCNKLDLKRLIKKVEQKREVGRWVRFKEKEKLTYERLYYQRKISWEKRAHFCKLIRVSVAMLLNPRIFFRLQRELTRRNVDRDSDRIAFYAMEKNEGDEIKSHLSCNTRCDTKSLPSKINHVLIHIIAMKVHVNDSWKIVIWQWKLCHGNTV